MKISQDKFKTQFIEKEANKDIEVDKVASYMATIYDEDPVYFSPDISNMGKVGAQVEKICSEMKSLGFTNFDKLLRKFSPNLYIGNEDEIIILRSIKNTMECIFYLIKHSPVQAEFLANQYKDRNFLCHAGTLSNLQGILSEILLGKDGIDANIISQKRQLITQIAMEMYKQRRFPELNPKFKIREIHDIISLLNVVADDYGLLKKTNREDRYLKDITNESRVLLFANIEEKLNDGSVIFNFIDSIAMEITTLNLPFYDKSKGLEFINEVMGSLKNLHLDNIIELPALLHTDHEGNVIGYKPNIQSIMRDVVTVYLHEKGILQHPEIEFIKFKLVLESNSSQIDGGIDKNDWETASQKGFLNEAIKYIIDNNLKLDPDYFPPSYLISYVIDNNIQIEDKPGKQYILESIIEQYFSTNDPIIKENLANKYKDVQQMGQPINVLTLESDLGSFLQNKEYFKIVEKHKAVQNDLTPLLNMIDYTICDLPLIALCKDLADKSEVSKPRDYNKFTINQKIAFACSFLLTPIAAIVTYYFIKSHNKSEKRELEEKINVSLAVIKDDLEKISPNQKPQSFVEKYSSSTRQSTIKNISSKDISGNLGI